LSCLNRALDATESTLAGVFRKAAFWKFHPAGSINDRQRIIVNKRDILGLVEKGVLIKDSAGGRSTS
jgi:hypothetical protein